MTKDEFLTRLRALGYDAENEEGCVTVVHPDRSTFDEIRQIAEREKYRGSFGWRKNK